MRTPQWPQQIIPGSAQPSAPAASPGGGHWQTRLPRLEPGHRNPLGHAEIVAQIVQDIPSAVAASASCSEIVGKTDDAALHEPATAIK